MTGQALGESQQIAVLQAGEQPALIEWSFADDENDLLAWALKTFATWPVLQECCLRVDEPDWVRFDAADAFTETDEVITVSLPVGAVTLTVRHQETDENGAYVYAFQAG